MYSGSAVSINVNTGRITASTTSTYSVTLYVQYCCDNWGSWDCMTYTEPLTVECCHCSLSSITISQPAGFQTSYAYAIDGSAPNF